MPKEQRFHRDGRDWIYTPGPNSSLISVPAANSAPMGMVLDGRKKSKSIMAAEVSAPQKIKARQGIAKVLMSKTGY